MPLPSAPVLLAIVPPEAAVPVPTTVKLPLVFERIIPFAVPPDEETVVSEITTGVAPLLLVTLTAPPLPVLITPLVVVMVLVLSVALNPALFEVVLVIFSVPKVIVPVLPVPVPPKTTAVPPELVTVVLP